jgi:oxygen-independent coproporphyrinogen-3 oxidase
VKGKARNFGGINAMNELSLYIHIPFCARKCRYCDFYSAPAAGDLSVISRYIDALAREWAFWADSGILDGNTVNTIYVGGGTPSLLDINTWKRLDDILFSRIDKSNVTEWSVECNPESFSADKARAYAGSGVTRLTFGVQSLNPRELSICGRAHSAGRAREVLGDERLANMFESIGADIIYNLPGQTVRTLDDTLTSILSFPSVKHISAYELTIAEDTPFGRHKKILPLPPEDSSAGMYELIGKRCADSGMRQYETSNYALPGFESTHNKAYWSHKPYVGLGASAHSYIHPKRQSNASDIDQYISSVSSTGRCIDFEETITPAELAGEILFLGLRNADGIDECDFSARTGGVDLRADGREERLRGYVDGGLLEKFGSKWVPTPRGMLFADMMALGLTA